MVLYSAEGEGECLQYVQHSPQHTAAPQQMRETVRIKNKKTLVNNNDSIFMIISNIFKVSLHHAMYFHFALQFLLHYLVGKVAVLF